MIVKGSDKGSGISILMVRYDGDDIYIYIYTHTHTCMEDALRLSFLSGCLHVVEHCNVVEGHYQLTPIISAAL